MKSNLRVVKTVLFLFLLTIFLFSCGGGGDGEAQPEITADDLIIAEVTGAGNPSNPIVSVATTKDGTEAIGVLVERDSASNPTRVIGAIYLSEQKDAFILEARTDGLPSSITDSLGNRVLFGHYTDSTVDISIIDIDGNLLAGPGTVNIDPATIAETKELFNSISLVRDHSNLERSQVLHVFIFSEGLRNSVRWAGLALGIAGCTFAVSPLLTTVVGTPVAVAAGLACTSLTLSALGKMTGDEILSISGTSLSTGLCATIFFGGGSILDCASAIVDFLLEIAPEFTPPPSTFYSIDLRWNPIGTDVDLHLRPPDGVDFLDWGYLNDCAFYNLNPDWGILGDNLDDPLLNHDCITDCTDENITVLRLTDNGIYKVLIHYYRDQGLGPATVTVDIFQGGVLKFSDSQILFNSIDNPDGGDIWIPLEISVLDGETLEVNSVNELRTSFNSSLRRTTSPNLLKK